MCEVGKEMSIRFKHSIRLNKDPLKIIWSGLHVPRKNLPLIIKALSLAKYDYELHILGSGSQTNKWKKLSEKYNIYNNCIWHGWLQKSEALDIYNEGHIFCISSISELTSTVTLEAISCGLPIVCLDHFGFSHIVDSSCGIKIPVLSPEQAVKDFDNAFYNLYNDEKYRQRLSKGALNRSENFRWDVKIQKLNKIYEKLISK